MAKRSGSTGSDPGPMAPTCGLGPRTLYTVVAVGGAAVMAIEVPGTRIIAPYFGASLVVWAAMISVTLLSLAVGYWVGGSLSVKGAGRWTLCLLLGASAIWVILVSWSSSPVLQWSDGLGLRAGVLVLAVVLFGVPLASLRT